MSKAKQLVLTVGLPRSGKTTWAMKQWCPVVCPDAIRLAFHGQAFLPEAEPMVWVMAKYMVRSLFLAGHTRVVVDATHVSAKRRKFWIDVLPSAENLEVVLQAFYTDPEICKERALETGHPELLEVIDRMAKEWDLPDTIQPEAR